MDQLRRRRHTHGTSRTGHDRQECCLELDGLHLSKLWYPSCRVPRRADRCKRHTNRRPQDRLLTHQPGVLDELPRPGCLGKYVFSSRMGRTSSFSIRSRGTWASLNALFSGRLPPACAPAACPTIRTLYRRRTPSCRRSRSTSRRSIAWPRPPRTNWPSRRATTRRTGPLATASADPRRRRHRS